MFWFVMLALWIIVAGGGLIAMKSATTDDGKATGFVIALIGTFIFLAITGWQSFARVETGHVGIVRTFGRITGQIDPGITFIAPWKSYDSVNVQVQKKTFDDLAAFSSETQNVTIKTTINYSISKNAVQSLISNVGTDWFDRLVPNNLNQSFKDETVKFKAVDIAPNREAIRSAVISDMRKRLSKYSITINDINVDNIKFSPQFEAAIEAKQEATQSALRAEAQVQQAKFEAQSKVAEAQGTADANVAVAAGQAEANRKLNASLSDNVLQYIAIQKLNPNLQIAILPSGSNSLIDPTKFLQQGTGK